MTDATPPTNDDDDYELELEPVDPEILAHEKARGSQRTEAAVGRIDVDELYGETGNYSDLTVDWSGLRRFRFTTRHLLILTAVLAIVLTLFTLLSNFKAIAVIAAVMLGGGWFYASQLERRQQAERARRRAEFFGDGDVLAELADSSLAAEASRPRLDFKFSFSVKELLITTTVVAVVMAIFTLTGGPEAVSLIFGALALAGLVAHALGVDPSRQIVLAWWLSLVIYLAVGLFQLLRLAG